MKEVICEYCSEIIGQKLIFPNIDSYRKHLRTSGHEINYNVYMDIYLGVYK